MEYNEDDFLQLSGIQHFFFCRRQWGLIHIENKWQENERTVDGRFFHENAHNSLSNEKRGDIIISRGMYIHSRKLGLTGQCDIVEFYKSKDGVGIYGYEDLWLPYPVEYKRGRKKPDITDCVQVCAQAMCLEEMYCCSIREGAIFYGENCRRQIVDINEEIREKVTVAVNEMHALYKKGHTPRVKRKKVCEACSLEEQCMPQIMDKESVSKYINRMVKDVQ